MSAEPAIAELGRRGLNLEGWGERSVWGWDAQAGSLLAQLWHDGEDADDGPDIWISPPAWEPTAQPVVLAQRIAIATGEPLPAVLQAMARSVTGCVREELLKAQDF